MEVDQLIQARVLQEVWNSALNLRNFMAAIGFLYASKCLVSFLWRASRGLRIYAIPKVWYKKDFRDYGSWAVVTGCSEGIGRSYALKLADRKLNVILISRSEAKLKELVAQIKEKGVEAKYLVMDLCRIGQNDCFKELESFLAGLDIGVLVNNVGVMYDQLQYFLDVPRDRLLAIVDLNIKATVLITHLVLPGMVSRQRGAIINIGSGASIQPTPLMCHYSASKSFVDKFSRALEYEYRSSKIVIQVVHPFYVSTKMTGFGHVNWLMVDPDDYAEYALRTLGITTSCYGVIAHGVFGWIGEIMPEKLYMFCALYVNRRLWHWLCQNLNDSRQKLK